jgi:chorismate-pyruvate lyase
MKLKPIHRILLATDGSITRILEALTCKAVQIKTVEQQIIKADASIAKMLKIEEGEDVNYRVVNLKAGEDVLAHAVSYTPIKRLKDEFKEDLMKADLPIGRIMREHNIEARREINWERVEGANADLAKIFGIKEGEVILARNYNIIHCKEILINITEYFPASKFDF